MELRFTRLYPHHLAHPNPGSGNDHDSAVFGTWNEFLLAYLLNTKETLRTLPIGLVYFQGQYATDWGGVGAGHDYCQLVNGYLIFILHRSKWNVLNG
jgi:hypothetical protein